MSSRAASPRVLILVTVVAVHAGALLVLLAETRTRLVRGEAESSPLLVVLLPMREPGYPGASARAASLPPVQHLASPSPAGSEVAPAAPPAAPGAAIDWAAQATASAARQVETDEQRARQARALAPKASPMFAAQLKRPAFHWNYARTHRVEAVPGLGTVIHLNDQCAIMLFVIIPILGCALEKPPVRSDLFEHMHDPLDPDQGP
jgi:hypothetical protein